VLYGYDTIRNETKRGGGKLGITECERFGTH
jgi:hypothetical protein